MTSLHSVMIDRSKDAPHTAVMRFQLPSASHTVSASSATCESQMIKTKEDHLLRIRRSMTDNNWSMALWNLPLLPLRAPFDEELPSVNI